MVLRELGVLQYNAELAQKVLPSLAQRCGEPLIALPIQMLRCAAAAVCASVVHKLALISHSEPNSTFALLGVGAGGQPAAACPRER